MTIEEMSPERNRAFYKFKEAEHQFAKHHYEQAIGLAHDTLEIDPTYNEVRHWIVDVYIRTGEPRKASLALQDILHADKEDQEAWTKLRAVDSAAAERLERLHTIAPDPFVVQRTAANAISEDLDDLGGFEGLGSEFAEAEEVLDTFHGGAEALDSLEDLEGTEAVTSLLQDNVGAVPLGAAGSGGGAADYEDLDMTAYEEAEAEGGEEAPVAEAPVVATAAPAVAVPAVSVTPTGQLPAWLYEEDLKYRQKMDHNPVYAKLLPKVIEFWKNDEAWDTAICGSVHLDETRHPEIVQVCREVAVKMGVPSWLLYVCPERRMICTITRGAPPTISLTTGMINTLNHTEQAFVMGRHCTMVLCGHVAYLQMATLTLERSPRSITDVEIDMLELLKHEHAGWDAGVHREDRVKLGALCHAWQQRAELTADRGGLIACGDLEAACNAIAKTVCADSTAAQTANWKTLMEKYKGQDTGQLAAIASKEDPVRHEGYGVYRLQMLRWWANTPAGKALVQG